MKAQALISYEDRTFSLESVDIPDPGANQILVKAHYSGVSIGTEFALIRNRISWGAFPICTGYMAAGVVEKTGADVDNFSPGDKVYYRGGSGITLDGKPAPKAKDSKGEKKSKSDES